MARIDIGIPYKNYLESLVEAGSFRSITAAAEASILKQMQEDERIRIASIEYVLAKGEADINANKMRIYTPNLMKEISQKGKEAALEGKKPKSDVTP